MSDYTLNLITNLRKRAKEGAMLPETDRGMGGALADWMSNGAYHIATEGYSRGCPLADALAELPDAPAGCECEGCNDRRAEAAGRLLDKIKRLPPAPPRRRFGSFVPWRNCKLCNAVSERAGWAPDRLCPNCYARGA